MLKLKPVVGTKDHYYVVDAESKRGQTFVYSGYISKDLFNGRWVFSAATDITYFYSENLIEISKLLDRLNNGKSIKDKLYD